MTANIAGARSPAWNAMTVPDGRTGFMELLFPWQVPGGGAFRIDEDGNVTTTGDITAESVNAASIGLSPTGDITGTDDTAALNAALSALPATGGQVILGSGVFYLKCGSISVNQSGVYIKGQGAGATVVYAVGAGDLFNMYDSSNANTRTVRGGGVQDMTIDLINTTGNSSGLHYGDILYGKCTGLEIRNATAGTTSKGFWGDCRYYWTENCIFEIYTINCTNHHFFDVNGGTGSFDRCKMDLRVNQTATAQNIVTFNAGAALLDGELNIRGNVATVNTTPPTTAVLLLTGNNAGAYSSVVSSLLNIGVEADGGNTYGPITIKFAAGSNNVQNCNGILDFSTGPFQESNNGGQFNYHGFILGDPTLPTINQYGAWSQTIATNGTLFFLGSVIDVAPAAGVTGVILGAGSVEGQDVTVVNRGAGTITFATAATSHVSGGTSVVIPAAGGASSSTRRFIWSTATNLWY